MASEAEPLRDLWYMPALSSVLKPGQMRREMLLGEPVLLGRMRDGQAFAMRDICPHRGVPLSAGKILAENTVECPYHGWRFRRDGVCSAIPSLVEGQDMDPDKIRVTHYPVREQDGLIWVYVADKPAQAPEHRAAARARPECEPALDRNPDFSLRHRPCRDRADGPGAWALCPCPLVVERIAAGEGKTLRAPAHRVS